MLSQVASGFSFPESPRWHDGRLWFVDRDGPVVYSMRLGGGPSPVASVPPKVMGLGFSPDGALVVNQVERRFYRIKPDGRLALFADLAKLTPFWLNDMLVLPDGSGYVGSFGFDLMNHAQPEPSQLIRFEADGAARFVGPPLLMPNGIGQLSTGKLVVAESFGSRLTVLDVDSNGDINSAEVLLDRADRHGHPDGLAIDAEDSIWYADTFAGTVTKVSADGEQVDVIDLPCAHATSCAFVGTNLDQLAITTTDHLYPPEAMAHRSGRILIVAVDVPGRRDLGSVSSVSSPDTTVGAQ